MLPMYYMFHGNPAEYNNGYSPKELMKHWLLVASWLKIKTYSDSSPAELIFASKYLLCLFPREALVSSY